jgi:putative transposase
LKYAFIRRHRAQWPITVQCPVLRVSAAGYHEHMVRQQAQLQGPMPCRHLSDMALLAHIRAIHAQSKCSYGWPRVWHALRQDGIAVGKQRVQKLMQCQGIRAKGKRRFRLTTDSNHNLPIAPNVLNREFAVSVPDLVWAGDLTNIATNEGWLFLAVVSVCSAGTWWAGPCGQTCPLISSSMRCAWLGTSVSRQTMSG